MGTFLNISLLIDQDILDGHCHSRSGTVISLTKGSCMKWNNSNSNSIVCPLCPYGSRNIFHEIQNTDIKSCSDLGE